MKRNTALSYLGNINEWKVFNPIFDLNTTQFDKAFSGEYGLDPEYYLEHKVSDDRSFEDRMLTNLFSGHGNPDSKLYLLRGDLGVGKTTFVHHMGTYKLPQKYKNIFFMYINCYKRFPKEYTNTETFDKVFRRIFKEAFINKDLNKKEWQFSTEAQLAQAILHYRGVTDVSDLEALRELNNSGADILLPFLLENFNFKRILIAIDNMDDCSEDVKEIAFTFAQSLSDIVIECSEKQSNYVSVLVPLRRYTNFSTDTEIYPRIDMPKHSTADIMSVKIEHVKDLIDKNYDKNVKTYINRTTYKKKEVVDRHGKIKVYWLEQYSGKWVSISSISKLFKTFIQKTKLKEKNGLVDFIEKISGGNLKLVTRNTYNIFHSCKLNIPDIINFVYTVEGSQDFKELLKRLESSSFGPPIIYDLSMAIHYPFFDYEASCILNLFNVMDSSAPNDWRNSLGIIRLLCYLNNNGSATYEEARLALEAIGYSSLYFEKSVKKCLDYCVLNTQFGTKLEHLSQSTTLELSSAGKYMIEMSICDHRYLSYACENTMMEEEYIINIEDKYKRSNTTGNIKKIHESARRFYKFLCQEEYNEIKYIINNCGWTLERFLRNYSLFYHNRYLTVSDFIKERVERGTGICLDV